MPYPASTASSAQSRRAVYAACIGNMLEWYDFGVYAYLAVQLAANFFPGHDPVAAQLATFAVYGVGFLARPLGGILIGRMGDVRGRKSALLLTIVLMAIGTIGVGVLPTYASIGLWAPALLVAVRIVQGLAAGGEWGTSTAFIVEWAPPRRRGLYGSFQQVSTAGGSLLGSAIAAILNSTLSAPQMLDWGWRLPFLLGVLLLAVGVYIRRNIEETPHFAAATATVPRSTAPSGPRLGLLAFGFTVYWTVGYYIFLAYMPTFTRDHAGLSGAQALWANTIGLIAMVISVPFWGALSDRIGRKPVLLASTILVAILAWPLFHLITVVRGWPLIALVQIVFGVLLGLFSGAGPAAISEIFPTRLRATWMSIGYTIAVAIFGGFASYIAIWLIRATGSPLAPALYYLIPSAIISTIVVALLPDRARGDLH
jgi:MHS family proline/betaine transporter-like MFS transporter